MLVEITSAVGSSSAEEIAMIGSNAAIISTCFCRVGFGKEVLATSPIDASLNEVTVYPMINAMVSLLQKDVLSALSPPAAVAPTPAAPGQQANAAAAVSAAVVPTPFPTDKCIHIITSLGRMVQVSDKCKSWAKEQGILPVLLDCFRVSQDHRLHQVTDKLLHLSVELPKTDAKKLRVDPRVFSIVREDAVATVERNDASAGELAQPAVEKAPFLAPENVMTLLETSCTMDDKRVLFRLVRWLATVVESPENALALGESSIGGFSKILIETSPENLLLFGFLSKCVMAIVSQSSDACEVNYVTNSVCANLTMSSNTDKSVFAPVTHSCVGLRISIQLQLSSAFSSLLTLSHKRILATLLSNRRTVLLEMNRSFASSSGWTRSKQKQSSTS